MIREKNSSICAKTGIKPSDLLHLEYFIRDEKHLVSQVLSSHSAWFSSFLNAIQFISIHRISQVLHRSSQFEGVTSMLESVC